MKYRYFWAMLFCFALLLSGCGAETNTDAVQPDVPDASSEAAQPDAAPADTAGTDDAEIEAPAETLPEACMLWYDARETGGATERLAFDVPLAARADDGVRFDEGYSVRKTDGTYNDLALDRTQQGDFLESLSDAVRQEGSSGQLSWAGRGVSRADDRRDGRDDAECGVAVRRRAAAERLRRLLCRRRRRGLQLL